MKRLIARYTEWLHTRWPAGTVEPLPEVRADGSTGVAGVFIAGDLAGIPLLKFALDGGARVVGRMAERIAERPAQEAADLDLVILGAGVAGMAAAIEAHARGLRFRVIEAVEPFFTIVNFPAGKPIYTYPLDMHPAGGLQVRATMKESLVDELRAQTSAAGINVTRARAERVESRGETVRVHMEGSQVIDARCVLIAIGRSGDFRTLGVPGDSSEKVFNRLHDPTEHADREVLVVGGGDTALETAIGLALGGARVTLSYRRAEFSRAKPDNRAKLAALVHGPHAHVAIEHPSSEHVTTPAGEFMGVAHRPGRIVLRLATRVVAIEPDRAVLANADGAEESIPNDVVFTMLGREAPLTFLRRSGIRIANEMTPRRWLSFAAFVAFCTWLYNWKSGGVMSDLWYRNHWFPTNLPELLDAAGGSVASAARTPASLIGTLAISAATPSFYYTLAYSSIVTLFGVRRIQRRATPYVTLQTLTLMLVQVLPLFLLPEIILPLLHHNHLLPEGLANALFPVASYGHGREFWRAYGFILAWPLNVYNIFTQEPLWWWIGIGFVQTCVLIPLLVYFYGKGAYCGWICSCGALAETLGDTHRHKMPHGPLWNRLNMIGQGILAIAVAMLVVRIAGWVLPAGNWADRMFYPLFESNYKWWVDVFLAGVVGYGTYFWYSGRVWCRFMCPLAAWMHICARFTRFRIFADKKKCISCGQCTAVCHQGIDVMSFANKGLPMADPQCVRCSACVHTCPTGVLSFGRTGANGLIIFDTLPASPVQMRAGEKSAR